VRVPVTKQGKEDQDTRLEYRSLDPAANPYLAYSVILAAGLKGIREGYELPAEASTNLFEEGSASGGELLPQNLSIALDEMERSELVQEALGDHIFEWFLRNKRAEWDAYRSHVSSFEIQRYLRSW